MDAAKHEIDGRAGTALPPERLGAPRWQEMWRGLAPGPADEALRAELLAHYAQAHRKYHALHHLEACLAHFDAVRGQAAHPAEVEVALWFHDAIYVVRAPDNESRSADWARDALRRAGADEAVAQRVHALVMATRHDVAPRTADEGLLLDVDLAILGAPPALFDAYEAQIFEEFAAVPRDTFRANRRRILQGFLDREWIFNTATFRTQRERAARDNLQRSVQALAQ